MFSSFDNISAFGSPLPIEGNGSDDAHAIDNVKFTDVKLKNRATSPVDIG